METIVTNGDRSPSIRLLIGGVATVMAATLVLSACGTGGSEGNPPVVQARSLDDTGKVDRTTAADGAKPATGTAVQTAASSESDPILVQTGENLTGADLEQFVVRRYEAYWQAFDDARSSPTADPDIDYPELYNLAAGEQLELAYLELDELFVRGYAMRDPETPAVPGLDANSSHRVRIESLDGGVAELVSCLVNDQVRYEVESGAVLSDVVRTVQARSTMARSEGIWKVISSEAIALDEGVAGCWLEDESNYPY